jgi:hypothetical protein
LLVSQQSKIDIDSPSKIRFRQYATSFITSTMTLVLRLNITM